MNPLCTVAGNVGILNANPQNALDIAGNVRAFSSVLMNGQNAGSVGNTYGWQHLYYWAGGGGGYPHAIRTRHNGSGGNGSSIDLYPWQPSFTVLPTISGWL